MKYLVYFFLIWNAFFGWFITGYHSQVGGIVSAVDKIVVSLLLLHLVYSVLTSPQRIIPRTDIGNLLLWFMAISILSWLVNKGPIINAVQFLFSILKPIIIFYWIITFVKDNSVERFTVGLLAFLILLQIPVFLFGFVKLGVQYTGDNARGALNDSIVVGMLMWLGVILQLAYYVTTKRKVYIVGIVVCMALLAITDTKQVTLFLPIAVVILLRQQLHLTFRKIVVIAVVGGGLMYFFYVKAEEAWMNTESQGKFSYEDYNMLDAITASEKVEGYYSAIFELPKELPVPLLGAGPGEYGSYTAMLKRTPLAEKYIMYYDDMFEYTGVLTYRSSGLISIYGDLGIICLVLWLLMYYRVIKMVMNYGMGTRDPSRMAASFLAASSGMLILWDSIVNNIFEGNVFILNFFWILAGAIIANQIREKHTNLASE